MVNNKVQFIVVIGCLGVLSVLGWGQNSTQQTAQAETQLSDSSQPIQGANNADKVDPDDRPLSGAEDLSPGMSESSKNVMNASVRVEQRIDATPEQVTTGYRWFGDSDIFGTVSLNRSWKRNSFVAAYDGGEVFYAGQYQQNTHTFSVSQLLTFGRWSLTLSDQVIYAPESPFGMPGPQPQIINILGLNFIYFPNQTILTGQSTRLSNGTVGQVDYAFSRRTSLTATGSYSLLHYTASSAPDNNQAGGTLGYNYALTARDKIALSYGYQQLQFNYLDNKMDINTANLNYAHQVLGRFSFQFEGGAQLAKSFSPFVPSRKSVSPDAKAVLNSVWRRTQFSLSGSKAIMSGGGLSVATNTTLANISATRNLSRKWTASLSGGYAENSFIGLNEKYRSGFAGMNVQRSLGQHASLSFLYDFQKQIGNTVCSGSLCGAPFLRHSVGIGLNWQFRPVVFQ